MSHNNLSKTVAAVIFSLTIASALPVLAQSTEQPKPVKNIRKTSVETTYRPVNIATDGNAKVKACQINDVQFTRKYIQYKKADGMTFNMPQSLTPRVLSETAVVGKCSR
jgi:lysyl-tRNA synthetase class I